MVWNKTKEKLLSFIYELNKKHKTLKFDYKISTKQYVQLPLNSTKAVTLKIFKERGYHNKLTNSQIDNMKNMKRKQLLSTIIIIVVIINYYFYSYTRKKVLLSHF